MYGVTLRKNENIEKALRRFKKITEDAGILGELKKRRHFEKPSEVKRKQKKDAIRRLYIKSITKEEK